MPASVTLSTTKPNLVIGNFISAVKNHKTAHRISPQDQLGVQALGRTVGLALDQVQQAVSADREITITAADLAPLLPPTTTVLNVALTAASTTITVADPTDEGEQLVVFLDQDATGGRLIVWDTNFRFTTDQIDTTASTCSVFSFVGRTDPAIGTPQWFMTCTPITGAS